MKSDSAFYDRYIHFASELIQNYCGDKPFHLYLKDYFRVNKKHGSRDRKIITSLCYNYFRLGKGITEPMSTGDAIRMANSIFDFGNTSPEERLTSVPLQFRTEDIFPFRNELSHEISANDFSESFLQQPLLFIRIRPGQQDRIFDILRKNEIPFKKFSDSCLGFRNNTQVEKIFKINREVVIQDINSQQISRFFSFLNFPDGSPVTLWDACAASGGKSILASDYLSNIHLTVSDNRKSILQNLRLRFHEAGIEKYQMIQLDLSAPVVELKNNTFDLIIADVPCSGSGTWARTPEQLQYFKPENIEEYAGIQRTIIENCLPKLKKEGYLLYITCSVFAKENEDNVSFFCHKHRLSIIHQQYLKGYSIQADTLFGALLKPE